MTDWDDLVEPARSALETLISKGDDMADHIDVLAAKLAEVEAERDHWETVAIARQAGGIVIAQKLAEAEARIAHLENHIEGVAKDTHKIMVAYEAALPADTLYLSPEDAALFAQKYGHPNMDMVTALEDCVVYTRATTPAPAVDPMSDPRVVAARECLERIQDYALGDGMLDFIEGLTADGLAVLEETND